MKIIIWSPTSTIIEAHSIESPKDAQPLGGADKTLLALCQVLADEGHDIHAFIPIKRTLHYDNISYHPHEDILSRERDCDLFIHYRKLWAIPSNINYETAWFYSQDLADTPCFTHNKSEAVDTLFSVYDKVIMLSDSHKRNLQASYHISPEQAVIVGNFSPEIEVLGKQKPRHPRFIYASTPYRGLHILAKLWRDIKKQLPDAELFVCSSMSIYGAPQLDTQHFNPLYERLERMDGVHYKGSIPSHELHRLLPTCHMMLYPNTYEETFCNIVEEAKASGVPTITSYKGALVDRVGQCGVCIEGDPYQSTYQKRFVDVVGQLWADKSLYQRMRAWGLKNYRKRTHYASDIKRLLDGINKVMKNETRTTKRQDGR